MFWIVLLVSKLAFSFYAEVLSHVFVVMSMFSNKRNMKESFLLTGTEIHHIHISPSVYIFSCFPSLKQIKPLVGPTKDIMRIRISVYSWHEFFPHGNGI